MKKVNGEAIDYSITGPRHYIGGSDIAAVMNVSRWKTPLRLWAELTGKILRPDLSEVEAVECGTELEEMVCRWFSKKTGFKVRKDSRTFVHPDMPYLVGHIDRWVVGEDAIFEAKTTSAFRMKEWDGEEMPREAILQVNQYMGILYRLGKRTASQVAYVGCLVGGQRRKWKMVRFDLVLFEKQELAAKQFWENHVLADIAPMAESEDSETLNALFPKDDQTTLTIDGDLGERLDYLIGERTATVGAIEAAKEELEGYNNQIKQVLGNASYATTPTNQISWKEQSRATPDSEKMKADGIFDKYAKTSSFRVLRTTKRKGAIAA